MVFSKRPRKRRTGFFAPQKVFGVTGVFQKKRDVHKISARNSGVGNGCAPKFYGRPAFFVFSLLEKRPMPIKLLLLGGGRGGSWVFF